MGSIKDMVQRPNARMYRRAFVKRRTSTGLFETSWQEITTNIISFGKYKTEIDTQGYNRFRFSGINVIVDNKEGLFNPEDDDASLWYGVGVQQRSLFKIEAGFIDQSLLASGIYRNTEYPTGALWDEAFWDDAFFDQGPGSFIGILQGDILVSDKNRVNLPVAPLSQVFRDFAARNLTGWATQTASDFMTMVRNQTDGAGQFIFRPFFGDTTTNWTIDTTTRAYPYIATSAADDVRDKTVWDVMTKMAEAENKTIFTEADQFYFISRDATTTVEWEFHGVGSHNTEYGTTIKEIVSYGFKLSKFYSRVELKFLDADTLTSYQVRESTLAVSGANTSWLYGQKSFQLDNTWVQVTATASDIVDAIFTEFSALKREIDFKASFVPHLSIRDRVSISYDSSPVRSESLWDLNTWGDDTSSITTENLIWDNSKGDAIRLSAKEMKILSIEQDFDKFETHIIAREI